jgi:signal transduction histidine kinase
MKFYQFAKQMIRGNNGELEEKISNRRDIGKPTQQQQLEQAILTLQLSCIFGWEYDIQTGKLSIIPEQAYLTSDNLPGKILLEELYKSPFRQDQDSIRKKFKLAISRGLSFEQEIKKINAEGKEIWVRVGCQTEQSAGKTIKLKGYLQDITQEKKNELRRLNNKLNLSQQLLQRAIWQQENELGRIAVNLHENISQVLIVARNYLKNDRADLIKENSKYERGIKIVEQAIEQIKELYEKIEVPPLQLLGLQGSLSELIEKYNQLTPTQFVLSDYNEQIEEANEMVKLSLVRIAKELINNIGAHAQASEAWISLELIDRGILLSVKDDGIGFYPDKKQWRGGLNRIEILASQLRGHLQVHSTPGKGCEVLVALPWSRKDRFLT